MVLQGQVSVGLAQLYQYVSENCSNSNLALKGQRWVVGCENRLGNYSAAEQALEVLKNDYSGHEKLYTEIFELAYDCIEQAKPGVLNESDNKYMAVEEYERALWLCQDIVDNCSGRDALREVKNNIDAQNKLKIHFPAELSTEHDTT